MFWGFHSLLILLIVNLSSQTLGTSQVWFILLSRKTGNKPITLVGLFLIHQRQTTKKVQMFSCNGVIHSRKSWSVKLAGWLPRACRRRMQPHAWRAPSLHCSLVVLPTRRGCQAKDFLGAMRVLVWSMAVCKGKYSWQHWHWRSIPQSTGTPSCGLSLCFQVYASLSVIPSLFFTSMWITTPERNRKVRYCHEDNRKVIMFQIHFGLSSSLIQVVLTTARNQTPGN